MARFVWKSHRKALRFKSRHLLYERIVGFVSGRLLSKFLSRIKGTAWQGTWVAGGRGCPYQNLEMISKKSQEIAKDVGFSQHCFICYRPVLSSLLLVRCLLRSQSTLYRPHPTTCANPAFRIGPLQSLIVLPVAYFGDFQMLNGD